MIVVVDAYNVLKQVLPSVQIGERERNSFIQELGRYARQRQHKIILVFDGGPYDRASQERIAGVYVVYAGCHETADEYIKRYLTEHRELDLLLVSSDREVRAVAHGLQIESVRAPDFYAIVCATLHENNRVQPRESFVIKTTERDNPELDELMREGSRVVRGKVDDMVAGQGGRKSLAQRPSKKERKIIKKIGKL